MPEWVAKISATPYKVSSIIFQEEENSFLTKLNYLVFGGVGFKGFNNASSPFILIS